MKVKSLIDQPRIPPGTRHTGAFPKVCVRYRGFIVFDLAQPAVCSPRFRQSDRNWGISHSPISYLCAQAKSKSQSITVSKWLLIATGFGELSLHEKRQVIVFNVPIASFKYAYMWKSCSWCLLWPLANDFFALIYYSLLSRRHLCSIWTRSSSVPRPMH